MPGLHDGGPHYGLHIDGLRKRCELAGFPAVGIVWIAESSYNLAEASEAVGENSGRRQTSSGSCVTGASLLEEGASARRNLFSLATFCRSKGFFVPQSLDEAVRIAKGWYSISGAHSSLVTAT